MLQLLQQGRAQAVLHIGKGTFMIFCVFPRRQLRSRCAGDIAYAVGHASQWDEFYNFVQPVASAVP